MLNKDDLKIKTDFGDKLIEEAKQSIEGAEAVISGHYAVELACSCFKAIYNRYPEDDTEFETHKTNHLASTIIKHYTTIVADYKQFVERQEKLKEDNMNYKVKTQFITMNKPHEQGTVAQIAERLGVSISEVRRRKREGTL